jgi:ketosteroid isomerase-like protein
MKADTMITAAIAALLLLGGCAKKQEEAKEEPKAAAPVVDLAAEEQAVRTRSGEWMNYANSKDAASIGSGIFAADAIMISDDKAYRGTAEIQAALEEQIKKAPDALVSWTSDKVRVADSGDLAVEFGSFTFDPDGEGKKPARQGSFATTWAKVDGQWRVTSDAGGDNIEAAKP